MDCSLRTDGARIAYRVVGDGPLLFLVGAPAGLAGFADLAARMAQAHTVVTHDPRGIGASSLDDGTEVNARALADDLHALIQHVGASPVSVFGASGGGVTGLDLLARYPADASLLIAHEPPLFRLLSGDSAFADAEAAFARAENNVAGALQDFVTLTQITQETYEAAPPVEVKLPPIAPGELEKNRFFLTRMAPATVRYTPDLDALRGRAIVIAAGEASVGQPARRSAEALAAKLGQKLHEAPGNHPAPSTQAARFAAWLTETLASNA